VDQIKDEVVYYYDTHPTEEDLMGETLPHAELIDYLKSVLEWLFRAQVCAIYKNFNFFQSSDEGEYPLAPDLAIIKGISRVAWRSWRVGIHGPAPHVVFEVASDKTWERDLAEKPGAYAAMGVQEYYAYDPYEPALPLSRRRRQRLFGWQRDRATGLLVVLPHLADGSLWSPHLESYLVPDDGFLRLYDRYNRLRLTPFEAESEARQAEAERADREARRANAAEQRARELEEKIRALGLDSDQLL
jgi:Uma2 family endonuclease